MSNPLQNPPEGGFYRMTDIVRTPTNRGKPTRLPLGRTTWLDGIKAGRFPEPARIGNLLVWPKSQIHELERRICSGELAAENGESAA